jgi:hypothetical protein
LLHDVSFLPASCFFRLEFSPTCSERVFRGENEGSAGKWMEQEVLFVEDIIDPEIEREILGRVVMDLHIHHEEIIERAEHM